MSIQFTYIRRQLWGHHIEPPPADAYLRYQGIRCVPNQQQNLANWRTPYRKSMSSMYARWTNRIFGYGHRVTFQVTLPAGHMDEFRILRRDRVARRWEEVPVEAREEYWASEWNAGYDDRTLKLLWVKISMPEGTSYVRALYHSPMQVLREISHLRQTWKNCRGITLADPGAIY